MKTVLAVLAAVMGLVLSYSLAAGAAFEVRDPWIREAPPSVTVLAAYMVIRNPGQTPAGITAITSPDFDQSELHRTVIESGIARMVPVGKLEISAGEEVYLEPDGMHLMLYNPKHPLHAGDQVTLIIHGSDGTDHAFTVPVKRAADEATHQHE